MPELPEVQTIVNDLNAGNVCGASVSHVRVCWGRTIAEPTATLFCRRLRGQRIERIWRRGKLIVMDVSGGLHWLTHLRMAGRLHLGSAGQPGSPYDRVIVELTDGRQLRFHDTRKFGRMYLVRDIQRLLSQLGPEPLAPTFTARSLAKALAGRRRQIKPLLLDQRVLAGLGNIYVDEALWAARLHPCRPAGDLSGPEIRRLHRAIRKVLRQGLQYSGTSLGGGRSNFRSATHRRGRNQERLKVYRRADQPCSRCRTTIRRIVVGQRGTHICTTCQS